MANYQSLHQNPVNGKTGYKAQNEIAEASGTKSLRTFKNTSIPTSFRLWIPVGTKSVNLLAHVSQSTSSTPYRYGFVARLNQAPATRLPSDISALNSAGFTLTQLSAGDCLGRNSSGYIFFAKASGLDISAGVWLYVDLYILSGSIMDLSSTIQVDIAKFKAWYGSATWLSNGDPPEGAAGAPTAITAVPSQLVFGYVKVGASLSKSFTLTNPLSIPIAVSITSYPVGFSGNLPAGTLVGANQSKAVSVTFAPPTAVAHSGSIRVDAGGIALLIPVSGTGAAAEAPPETPLQIMISDLSKKLSDIDQSKKNLDQMIDNLGDAQACVAAAAASPAVVAVPSVAALIDFHLNKTAGSFGSYGINPQLSRLQEMSDSLSKEKAFYELAIDVYNRLDKGLALSPISDADLLDIGYDTGAGTLYNKDMDHPGSRARMAAGADLHMQNRPLDASISGDLKYVLPASSTLGDTVCLSGKMFMFSIDPTGQQVYYPVGIQEPDSVCTNYDLYHSVCEAPSGQ